MKTIRNYSGAVLYEYLDNIELKEALEEAAGKGVSFSGADLSRADLRFATLRKSNLHRTCMIKACIFHANFDDTDLSTATLLGAIVGYDDSTNKDYLHKQLEGINNHNKFLKDSWRVELCGPGLSSAWGWGYKSLFVVTGRTKQGFTRLGEEE